MTEKVGLALNLSFPHYALRSVRMAEIEDIERAAGI
jgi:hypothetical protein